MYKEWLNLKLLHNKSFIYVVSHNSAKSIVKEKHSKDCIQSRKFCHGVYEISVMATQNSSFQSGFRMRKEEFVFTVQENALRINKVTILMPILRIMFF